jgi:hypothetical protein
MLVALLMVTMVNADWTEAELRARIKASPPDVAAFVSRRIGCNHWEGESDPAGNIPERERNVQRVLRSLRCERIDRDERALQRKYRRNEDRIRLLRELHDFLP